MPLRSKIKSILIFFALYLGCLGTACGESFTPFTGQVSSNSINVRVDSTVGAKVVCTLAKGELVEIVREAYDWYKIRLPKDAPSYIRKDLLECNNFASNSGTQTDFAAQSDKCLSAKVIKDRVNVRLEPDESSWILGKVDRDTVVNIIAEKKGWYKIHPVYQSYGWVNKRFVNKEIVMLRQPPPDEIAAPPKEPADLLVAEGRVSPYGVVLWRKATHKLITADDKTYLLKGDRQGLNSLNGRKVKVTGRLISPAASKYPIIQVNIIEALS